MSDLRELRLDEINWKGGRSHCLEFAIAFRHPVSRPDKQRDLFEALQLLDGARPCSTFFVSGADNYSEIRQSVVNIKAAGCNGKLGTVRGPGLWSGSFWIY